MARMQLSFTPAERENFEKMYMAHLNEISAIVGEEPDTPENIQKSLKGIFKKNSQVHVTAGKDYFCVYHKIHHLFYIVNLYVKPESRQKGIGKKVLNHLIGGYGTRARAQFLLSPNTPEALGFYSSLGFTEICPFINDKCKWLARDFKPEEGLIISVVCQEINRFKSNKTYGV